jgi:hypothetical protein
MNLEDSEENQTKRQQIAVWAVRQSDIADKGGDSSPYKYEDEHSTQYPKDSNKCSAFTCDAAEQAGAPIKVTVPNGRGTLERCPTAAEINKGTIPGWRRLKPGEAIKPGDIGGTHFGSGAVPGTTGHAFVVVGNGAGGWTTVGAHAGRVGPLGADGTGGAAFIRYTGN